VIDLHAHLLPGVDDGPATMGDALRMARVAVESGTTVMACTPHLLDDPDRVIEQVAEGVPRLREALAREGIALEVLPGAEIAIPMAARMDDDRLRAVSLGGTGRWLLIEMPFKGWPLGLADLLRDLEVRGFRVLLAHPERSESVQLAPDRLRDLVGRGALVQVTAGSLTGEHGPRPKRAAGALLRNGFVHVLASDAHSADWRPPGLADGLTAAARVLKRPPEEIGWMVEDGPRLIAAGEPQIRPPRLLPGGSRPAAGPPDRSAPARSPRTSPGGRRPGG
jgi:protein-tyrosine phosphatase